MLQALGSFLKAPRLMVVFGLSPFSHTVVTLLDQETASSLKLSSYKIGGNQNQQINKEFEELFLKIGENDQCFSGYCFGF